MLVDEVVHYEPRREIPSVAQVIVQEASTRTPIPESSAPNSPRTLKKPKPTRAQYNYGHYRSPSTASSSALPRAAVGHTPMASNAGDSPAQSPSSSPTSRKLLKLRQGSTIPLLTPSFHSPTSPVPPASAATSRFISPSIPPLIPQIQASLSGLPDERARNATQFISPERPAPESTLTRPLLSPLRPSGTPTVEIPLQPRMVGVGPVLVPRYSKVRNTRWALWALYLLFGLGNLILALRMRNTFPKKWDPPTNNEDNARRSRSYSLPRRELVDLWKIAPMINVFVTCGLLVIYWAVDKWYPVTFISRPLSEMLFYLVLFGIQIATTVDQALYVERTVQSLVEAYQLDPPAQDELRVEARASSVFMSIQALIVVLAFGVVAYHVVHHIRHQGSKAPHLEVLKHPTCRYTPHGPPATAFFASPFDTTRFKNEISSTNLPV